MAAIFCLVTLICVLLSRGSAEKKINLRPIIGIVSQMVTHEFTPNIIDSRTYIAASYVKYLETAGAQVIPIIPSFGKRKIKQLVHSINGVLFPGGAARMNDSGYYTTAKIIFKEAIKLNKKGDYFPLWGTCLGFETLHDVTAGVSVLSKMEAENLPLPLNLTRDAFESRLFDKMPKNLMRALMFKKISLNMHHSGVSTKIYETNLKINTMFRVLSTNYDIKGKEFVSTVEGKFS